MALSKMEKELCSELKKIITHQDTFVGTMLMLTINQQAPDGNCKKFLDFIRNTSNVGYDEVLEKADKIVGIK